MRNIDLEREEQFGFFTSRIYSFFASYAGRGIYDFASSEILKKRNLQNILDVGTGPGILTARLAAGSKKLQIYAIDPSKDMLGIARKRQGNQGVRFAIGYGLYVPFRSKFDMIISSVSFHHWAHKKESLKYLSGFLSNGGEIRIYEFKKRGMKILGLFTEEHSMNRKELEEAADGTGLTIKEIKEEGRFIRAIYIKD